MTTLKQHLPLLGFGLALTGIYLAAVFVAAEIPRLEQPGLLAAALTLDLTVMVPLLYYLLLARGKGWPLISMAPVFLLSLATASFIVPATHQDLLDLLKYLVAPAEVLLLGYLGLTVARTARRFRDHAASDDVIERLRESLYNMLKARLAADMITSEIGLFYYALFSWRARPADPAKHGAFSYHKKNGYGPVVAGILVAMLMEVTAVHVVLWMWNPALAWVATALGVYGFLWLLGDWRAVCLRPISVEKDALIVRIGLRWTARVPFASIASVRPIEGKPPARKTPGYLEALLLGKPRYLIALNEPIVAQGLYGIRKTITTLGLAVDNTEAFETALKHRFEDWKQSGG